MELHLVPLENVNLFLRGPLEQFSAAKGRVTGALEGLRCPADEPIRGAIPEASRVRRPVFGYRLGRVPVRDQPLAGQPRLNRHTYEL